MSSDASFPLCDTADHDKAGKSLFAARQEDERERKAWDRRIRYESTDTDEPKIERTPFVPAELHGVTSAPVTISPKGRLSHLHKVPAVDGEHASYMETRSGKFHARIEATLHRICRDETGQFETDEERKNRIEKDERLKRQGSIICDALERVGVVGYRADAWQLVSFGVHSHEIQEIPAFRRICLNPYVAHRLRLPVLNWLQYFAQGRENALRFWTFTTGKRVLLHRLEARIKFLHRRISELNAEPFMRAAGLEIVFRSTELGSIEPAEKKPENDGETGGRLEGTGPGRWYHPHAHCVVWMKNGPLRPWRWAEVLRRVWEFWHHNWDEGKRIEDMREVVKYVVKPGDMVRLAEESPAELGALAAVLFRKKLVQPLGELLLQKRAADAAGLLPRRVWKDFGNGDRLVWSLELDHNRNRFADGAKGSGLTGSDGVKPDFRAAFDDASVPTPTEMTRTTAARYFARDRYGVKPQDISVCRVMARCSPAFNSQGVKEPRVIVIGSYFDRAAILAHPLVRRMVSATRDAYEAGVRERATELGALPLSGERCGTSAVCIRVHTGTPTVGADSPPDPGPLLFEPEHADDPASWAPVSSN